jgi:hypoxanthine phosphoribosyltransferase
LSGAEGSGSAPSSVAVKPLFAPEEIAARVHGLARAISQAMGTDFLAVALLKGSFVFAADLLRALHDAGAAPEVDFLTISSYGAGTVSTGQPVVLRDIASAMRGRVVLLIDDILESGRTLAFARTLLEKRGARTVRTCVLLDKPGKRAVAAEADFVGFVCPDVFVVGYGMDYAHRFRELPFIGMLEA